MKGTPPLPVFPVREEARRQLVRMYLSEELMKESQENGKQHLQEDEGNYDS